MYLYYIHVYVITKSLTHRELCASEIVSEDVACSSVFPVVLEHDSRRLPVDE